jgi:hypothetical protein
MGDDEEIKRIKSKFQCSQGYSVRKSEEALNSLEKENFNLKLKLFFLETKHGKSSMKQQGTTSCENEYLELFIENESLKKDLKEKQEIMKKAFKAIEKVEEEKCVLEKSSNAIIDEQCRKIDEQSRKIDALKV